MSFNRYYQEELVALRELGREFAEANPSLANFLATPGRDPDVERLLEGFAFLTGRLRQKLDDELPEITHALFNLLWPNYLRTIPSCSIIQYTPTGNLSTKLHVPRHTLVESIPVEGTPCQFRTAYNTDVYPISLARQHVIEKFGSTVLALDFKVQGGNLANLSIPKLRFYLGGEKTIAHTIYYMMLKQVEEVRVVLKDKRMEDVVVATIPANKIQPVGFADDHGLFPYPANTFPGYRVLQEYFCFPEKFNFIDVTGLEEALGRKTLQEYSEAPGFSLHFVLKELPDNYESFRKENWQLFCTPVVNLFTMDSSPIVISQKQTEYRIVPDPRRPYHFNIYSVDRVASWGQGRNDGEFRPFESFEHDLTSNNPKPYYRLRLKPSVKDDGTETYISIVQPAKGHMLPNNHIISMELTCTNRLLAQQLRLGDINKPATSTPSSVQFKNILPVTPPYNPPLEGDILWRLLSNMALNYLSLTSIPALRAVLTTYDFRALHDKQRARQLTRHLQGMRHITSQETDRIYRGLPLRGARTTLTLDEQYFGCEGEMYLFGSILNEFLALCATVNSFHQLTIVEEKRGEEYPWPARLGSIATL